MFDHAAMLLLFAESALHPGSGSSATAIDLPIQRESHTNLPLNQSSGLKGALRDACRPITLEQFNQLKALRKRRETANPDHSEFTLRRALEEKTLPWEIVFGPDTDRPDDHSGSIAPSDARLLLFPVRSAQGVFAWITCPLVLARFERDLRRLNLANAPLKHLKSIITGPPPADHDCLVTDASDVGIRPREHQADYREVVLEDFSFRANGQRGSRQGIDEFADWLANHGLPPNDHYFQQRMRQSIVIVSDSVFRDFTLCSTEVVARNKINDETGIVAQGALWNVENLPAETMLYSMVPAMRPANIEQVFQRWGYERNNAPTISLNNSESVVRQFKAWVDSQVSYMQIGGDQTIGRGLVSVRCLSTVSQKPHDTPASQGQGSPDQSTAPGKAGDE